MKKALSLLMCFLLLALPIVFLVSCNKNEDGVKPSDNDDVKVDTTEKTIDVDLTGYSIITDADLIEAGKQHVLSFVQSLSEMTAVNMEVIADTSTEGIETEDLEILIGQTSRKESIKTLNGIKGDGWAVRVYKHKIAIVGTTPYLTTVALNWFERTYLNTEHINGTVLSVQEKHVVSDMPILSLTEKVNGADTTFTVVYENGKDKNDAPYQIAGKVCESLLQKTGLTAPFLTVDATAAAREILVGNMSRADVKAEMAKIEADEYAVTIKDNKIYLVAWSDDVLPSAHALFEELLLACAVTDGNGRVTYKIPSDCTLIKKYASDWITDFPKPVAEGLFPEAAVDVNDGCLQYIYAGTGATRETFVAYCETLKAAGYTPMGNEDVQWEGSSFRTFVNKEKGVSLHVSHMAFAHAAEQKVDGLVNSIRIVSGSTDFGGTLVDEKYFRPQIEGTEKEVANGTADYVRRMDSQITSNMFDYGAPGNWGLGQIITLADGSFIVIDGGRAKGLDETANVWALMKEMHKKAHGEYPTKEKPAHIRAWIITHEHGDHHNILSNFCNQFGFLPEVKFDYLMENFGSMTQLRTAGGNYNIRNNLKVLQEKVKNGFEYIQVNTGQVFYFANCRLEILVTLDDMYPWRCSETNNATTVTRTALLESDGQNSYECTSLWLGDAEVQQSLVARAMYGSFLKSEQVQVAHHGSTGGSEKQLYELVGNCKVVWFPNCVSKNTVEHCLSNDWSFSPAFKNPECELLIFNGSEYNEYPRWDITLIITAKGALYDQLYDGSTGELIEMRIYDPMTGNVTVWPAIDVPAYREAIGR